MYSILHMLHGNFMGFFFAMMPVALVVYCVVVALDKGRVRSYFAARRCRINSISWCLFGHGWVAESSSEGGGNRIYRVEYVDAAGALKSAWCKTSLLGGVYLSDDVVIRPVPTSGAQGLAMDDKDAEINRLRAENETLRRLQQ